MSSIPPPDDYLDRLGVVLEVGPTHCLVRFGDRASMFPNIAAVELRARLNEAMHRAVAHFDKNAAAAGVPVTRSHVEELALGVVIGTLYVYNMWRQNHAEHRNHPLTVDLADLTSTQANDECWSYCRRVFGKAYVEHAAALTGMTVEALRQYERGRRRYFDR